MCSNRLFSRDFTFMAAGQTISLPGNTILRFALSLYVLGTTGSAAVFSGILAVSMVPTIFCSPLGGVLVDRASRQRIMWGLDFFTAALVLEYGLFSASRGTVLAVGVLMVLLAAIQALYQPSVQASISALASEEHLPAANGVVAQVQAPVNPLGPILDGILYGWAGLLPMVVVGGACSFCSVVVELFLRIPFQRRTLAGPSSVALWRDLRDAGRLLTREQPGLLRVLALMVLLNFSLSALLVMGLPYLAKISLGLSSLHYSFTEAAPSLSSIVDGLLSGLMLRGADIRRAWRFLLGTSLLLLPMALALALGIPSLAAYGVILVSVLLDMARAILFTVFAQTYLQRVTPPHLLGKVISFVAAISTCAMPLGQALYGLLLDVLQAHAWVVVTLDMGASLLVTFSSVRALGRLPVLDEVPSGGHTEQSLDSQEGFREEQPGLPGRLSGLRTGGGKAA